jgi:hypothetical protein
MSKRENDANNVFRQSDSPLTEHEKEQIALRKNLERLRPNDWQERLPMQVIHPNKKTAGVTDGPFVDRLGHRECRTKRAFHVVSGDPPLADEERKGDRLPRVSRR